MRHILRHSTGVIALLMGILSLSVSCSEIESSPNDVYVEWGFSQSSDGKLVNIVNGLSKARESVVILLDTFDKVIGEGCNRYDSSNPHQAFLLSQGNEKRAAETIRQLAEEAYNNLPENFSCPVDYYFSVRIGFGKSKSDRTVWSVRFPY